MKYLISASTEFAEQVQRAQKGRGEEVEAAAEVGAGKLCRLHRKSTWQAWIRQRQSEDGEKDVGEGVDEEEEQRHDADCGAVYLKCLVESVLKYIKKFRTAVARIEFMRIWWTRRVQTFYICARPINLNICLAQRSSSAAEP